MSSFNVSRMFIEYNRSLSLSVLVEFLCSLSVSVFCEYHCLI